MERLPSHLSAYMTVLMDCLKLELTLGTFWRLFMGVRFSVKILPPHLCLSFLINNLPEPHQLEQGLVISFSYSVVL